MIEFEEIDCPICDSTSHRPVSSKGRDYITTYTSICLNCGFVYQNPRWTKARISAFYRSQYDKYYRTGFASSKLSPQDYANYKFGFAPLLHRIRPHLGMHTDLRILDIGAGDGTNLSYLGSQLQSTELYAFEPSQEGARLLQEKGIQYLGPDVDADWMRAYLGAFDLVILRHVLEHLHHPNEFLAGIRNCIKPGGLLYIAVPDAYNIGKERLQREFFRIVHNYYFSTHSLGNLLRKHGFDILELKAGDAHHEAELFLIARPGNKQASLVIEPDEADRQLAYFSPIIQHEQQWSQRVVALVEYFRRRLYLIKVKIKTVLGIG